MKRIFGKYLIIDFITNELPEYFENADCVDRILTNCINEVNNTIVSKNYYNFSPFGLTFIYILAESSLVYHTYREKDNLISIDFYTCNINTDFNKFIKLINEKFNMKEIKTKKIIKRIY